MGYPGGVLRRRQKRHQKRVMPVLGGHMEMPGGRLLMAIRLNAQAQRGNGLGSQMLKGGMAHGATTACVNGGVLNLGAQCTRCKPVG